MKRRMTSLVSVLVLLLALAVPATATAQTPGPASDVARQTGDGSSRAAPLPVGSFGVVDHYQVRVLSVLPNADDAIVAADPHNLKPFPGNQFYIARVAITYTGFHTGHPGPDMYFQTFGGGRQYSTINDICGAVPSDRLSVLVEQAPETTAEFNICWQIDQRDAGSLVMSISPMFVYSGYPVWFSLDS